MPISPERILFEDEHILAVTKLAGELVVRGKGEVGKLPLLDFLKKDHPGLRALHRLDFETSGVVVFAKSKAAQQETLNNKFDQWKKYYHAIVAGRVKQNAGAIDKPLPARGEGLVEAVTQYKVIERFSDATLIEAAMETGRHHQIRRHMASIQHALVLDDLYGNKKYNQAFAKIFKYWKFFLHAARLELPHPVTGEKLVIESPLPDAFQAVLKKMRAFDNAQRL
jgi:23S rRNA pseudouridine955/2504/2580 synthase